VTARKENGMKQNKVKPFPMENVHAPKYAASWIDHTIICRPKRIPICRPETADLPPREGRGIVDEPLPNQSI